MRWFYIPISLAALVGIACAQQTVQVNSTATLVSAIQNVKPGTHILIAPGNYASGMRIANLKGKEKDPIIIEGQDPANPPVIGHGQTGLQFSDCAYLELRNIAITDQSASGLEIDDGGTYDTPAHHVVLENLTIRNIGPAGSLDPIKLSGVTNFVVRNCKIEAWSGQGVEMVGCHDGVIERCEFRGKQGFSPRSAAQCKGGTSGIIVRDCLFVGPLVRGVSGGAAAMELFRPKDAAFEDADITVEGCRFNGVDTPIAFVGVDGAIFRFNTVYHPTWALRILQENLDARLVRSRNGRYENNLVIFETDRKDGGVNIGPDTQPQTFSFTGNWWYCEKTPAQSTPRLPTPEKDGTYGTNPKLRVEPNGNLTIPANSPAAKVGAAGWKKP